MTNKVGDEHQVIKQHQRRLAYDARQAQADKDRVSEDICRRFVSLPAYRQATTMMWYLHCRSEVRTLPALTQELHRGKRCVIPYCTKDNFGQNQLGLWLLEDLDELVAGTWGILEPPQSRWLEEKKQVDPKALDLIMVPGVAFDRRGGRLGNGAGYYDRLLAQVREDTELVGVCYEAQLLDKIDMASHDVYMDKVITERTVYQCN